MKKLFSVFIAGLIYFPALSQTQVPQNKLEIIKAKELSVHEYSVKIIAGTQPNKNYKELGRGIYSSLVNIYNPNQDLVYLSLKLVLTNPALDDGSSITFNIDDNAELQGNKAMNIYPMDYYSSDGNQITMDAAPRVVNLDYIEGFVVIKSTNKLDVSCIYSASTLSSNKIVALDIENIVQPVEYPEVAEDRAKADLIPVPFMDGKYVKFNPKPQYNNDWYYVKVRNIGTKPCGPFAIKLAYFIYTGTEGNPVPFKNAWISGLKPDEEKIVRILGEERPVTHSFKIIVDVDNNVNELNEDNNITFSKKSLFTSIDIGEIE